MIVSAVPCELNSVSTVPFGAIVAARVRSSATLACTSGAFTFSAFTTTVAVCSSLGNALLMRL